MGLLEPGHDFAASLAGLPQEPAWPGAPGFGTAPAAALPQGQGGQGAADDGGADDQPQPEFLDMVPW